MEREVPLEIVRHHGPEVVGAGVPPHADDPGAVERADEDAGGGEVAGLGTLLLVAAADDVAQGVEVAQVRIVQLGVALEEVEHHAVSDAETRLQGLRRTGPEFFEGVLIPGDLPLGRARDLLFAAAPLALALLDDVLGRLGDDAPLGVEPLAAGAAGDLLEVAHGEDGHLLAAELGELGEEDGADGDVHAHAQRVRAGDDLEQTLLRNGISAANPRGERRCRRR